MWESPLLWGVVLCLALAVAGEAAHGPRLTDADLFDALDLGYEGLEAVRDAVAARDLAKAKAAFAATLRGRTAVPWFFDPHKIDRSVRHDREDADRTVRGKVCVIGIWHEFPDGEIDWLYNPTVARKDLAVNYEWQWQLGRMSYWGNLGRTYWATGDEQYAQTFVRHLRSWAHQCRRPDTHGNTAHSPWRTIECGIRMFGSWPDAYHRFLLSPSFTDDDIALYVKVCIEHARHLRRYHRSANWLTMEMQGLYTVGAVFPELKEAEAWRRYAVSMLHEELDRQFLPDGAQIELTPGYHQVALLRILDLQRLAVLVGRGDEIPADYTARAEKAFHYDLYLMTPDRDLPKLNDSWHVNVPGVLARAVELYPERQDFRWAATDGREGAAPEQTSTLFPYAGYCALRSGWERDANFLCFDAGPLGTAHVHQDKLGVTVWAYGREVLFDGGGGQYEHSKWRSYDTGTFSHNTVIVDGLPQRREDRRPLTKPLDVRWGSTATHDFAASIYAEDYGRSGHRPATHHRRVLFVKPDLFVVADTVVPGDAKEHMVQARWHLISPETALDDATKAVATRDEDLPNLAVVPLLAEGLDVRSASAQEQPELLGWRSHKSGGKPWYPATTVLHTRKGAGAQHMLTLLVPLRKGAANPVAGVRAVGSTSADVTFADGRRLRVEADADPAGGIRVAEVGPDGGARRTIRAGE